jgi:phospholipid transport system substrate-binding protein
MFYRLIVPWFAALMMLAPLNQAWALDPATFISEFSQKSISDILAAEIPDKEKQRRFRAMFEEYFDVPYIGRFVLGRYWRLTSAEQKEKFNALFGDVIVQTWLRRFSEFNGQSLQVSSTVSDGDKGAIVKSEIIGNNGTTIRVNWRLRVRNPEYQVVDVIVEGVSMAITYRQEYSTVITRVGGFDGLLNEMQKKVTGQK